MASHLPPFVGHTRLTPEQVEVRKRQAENFLLTPEMRRANEKLRIQAQPPQPAAMLPLQRCWPWLLATFIAVLAISRITYGVLHTKAPVPQEAEAVQPVAIPAPADVERPAVVLSSILPSDDLVSSFKQVTALFQVANSTASTQSHTAASRAAAVALSTVAITSTPKAIFQNSRRGAMPPNPPSLSPPPEAVLSKHSSAVQTFSWGTITSATAPSSSPSLRVIHASSSSIIPIPGSFLQLWMTTVCGSLALCVTVFGISTLLGYGRSQKPELAPESSYGHASSLSGARTPMFSPYLAGSPDCSPARDRKTQELLRLQRRIADDDQKGAQRDRVIEQQRQMMGLIEEGLQKATEQEHEVRTQNTDLKKKNERLVLALDLAKGQIDMLKREVEAFKREVEAYATQQGSLDSVTIHGPTLAQTQPTVLRNLDNLLAHTNDREGSPSGLSSPPYSGNPARGSAVASPATDITSHAIPAEDASPPDSDSDDSDSGTPTMRTTQLSGTPDKSVHSLDAPTFRPLTTSPLGFNGIKGRATSGCDSQRSGLRSARSTHARRALHAVVQPLSFSPPHLSTGAAADDDEMVLGTTPTLPPFISGTRSTFLTRDTSGIAAAESVGSPSLGVGAGRLLDQTLASPAQSCDSNVSEQPPMLLDEQSEPVA